MIIVVLVFIAALIIAMVACLGKERFLTGFYSELGLFGRNDAYFIIMSMVAGVVFTLAAIVFLILTLFGVMHEMDVATVLFGVLICAAVGVGFGAFGFLKFKSIKERCPGELKKRLVKDMIVMMLGTSIRGGVKLFGAVFAAWLETQKPTAYTTEDGRTVYAYPNSDQLYDKSGNHVGALSGDGEAVLRN